MQKYVLLIISMVFLNHNANAVSCVINKEGVLDNLLLQFDNSAKNWQYTIEPIAKRLFYLLFTIEFMWQLTVKKVFAGDIEKLWVFFFTRISLCFLFAKYIVNIKLYQQLINYIANIGSQASGFSMGSSIGSGVSTLTPSEVLGNLSCMTDAIHQLTDKTGTFDYITLKITLAIIQVLLLIILIYMAFHLIKVILQTYFLLYVGFILTGFSGSSWTYEFWERYIRSIGAIAIKFLAFCFILGVLANQMHAWSSEIIAANNIADLSAIIIKIFVSSLIYTLLISELPEWAASSLSGSVRMGNSSSTIAKTMSGVSQISNSVNK